MPASITLRNGVVVPVAETAPQVRDALLVNGDNEMLVLHLDDRGEPGAVVYARTNEVALVIDTGQ